jgi:1-deoxy-D-xylulose-5-phosphate synthase
MLQDGHDLAILAIGVTVSHAMEAAKRLEQEGLSVAVINARFVKPLDRELIVEVARRVKCLVTVEESSRMGGFGSAVLELLSDEMIVNVPTHCIGLPDWYIEQGPQDLLREKYGLTANGIHEQARRLYDRVSTSSVLT